MKYELLKTDFKTTVYGKKVFRIKALRNINSSIKEGDLGGYIESEKNLSLDGDAWVYDNAQVYGDAWIHGNVRVYDNAQVYGNAQVYDNAQVYGNARVYDNARVYGDAIVYGDAWVYGNAWIFGNVRVYGNAQVSGNVRVYDNAIVYGNARIYSDAQVQKEPTCMSGIRHHLTVTETHIFLGCEGHLIEHWKKNIVKIGRKYEYSDVEIKLTIEMLKTILKLRKLSK